MHHTCIWIIIIHPVIISCVHIYIYIYTVRYMFLLEELRVIWINAHTLSMLWRVCVSMNVTWYLSEWWASSEDRGETTGDSPSRLMWTDNSIDCRKQRYRLLKKWLLIRLNCHLKSLTKHLVSHYVLHGQKNKNKNTHLFNSNVCSTCCVSELTLRPRRSHRAAVKYLYLPSSPINQVERGRAEA